MPVFQSGEDTEPVGMVFAGVNKKETLSSVISDVSARFREVGESASNLRETADKLGQNIKNFKL